jgi:hypothetical protein
MRPVLSLLLLTIASTVGQGRALGQGQIDPQWLKKTKDEGIAGYERYRALAGELEEVYEWRTEKVNPADPLPFVPRTMKKRLSRLGSNGFLESIAVTGAKPIKPDVQLECDNEDYSFRLGKKSLRAPWVLIDYAPRRVGRVEKAAEGLNSFAFYEFGEYVLPALQNQQGFALQALAWDKEKEALRIEITLTDGEGAKGTATHVIWVDPSRDWRITETANSTIYVKAHYQASYGVTVEDLTFPRESEGTTSFLPALQPPPAAAYRIKLRLVSLEKNTKGPDNYRLPAFGIREPADLKRPTPLYVWILAAAGLCGAVALCFRFLARRKPKAA